MYENFNSWQQAIQCYFDNILKRWGPVQTAYQLVNPAYCASNTATYNANVEHLAEAIEQGRF
jgi:hypothetical protein